ncbi:MAG: hypothetical protein ACRDPY_44945 [Streptosporangiaceae bacterium]
MPVIEAQCASILVPHDHRHINQIRTSACRQVMREAAHGLFSLAGVAFEQGGDLGDGFGAWADIPHRGPRVTVPGLGHDQLQGDALLAEVGGRGVPELVQLPPRVEGEQDPGAVVAEPGPPGGRAQVLSGGAAGRAGTALGPTSAVVPDNRPLSRPTSAAFRAL